MTFGEDWGSMLPGASKDEAKKIFDLFMSKGGNSAMLIKYMEIKRVLGMK